MRGDPLRASNIIAYVKEKVMIGCFWSCLYNGKVNDEKEKLDINAPHWQHGLSATMEASANQQKTLFLLVFCW